MWRCSRDVPPLTSYQRIRTRVLMLRDISFLVPDCRYFISRQYLTSSKKLQCAAAYHWARLARSIQPTSERQISIRFLLFPEENVAIFRMHFCQQYLRDHGKLSLPTTWPINNVQYTNIGMGTSLHDVATHQCTSLKTRVCMTKDVWNTLRFTECWNIARWQNYRNLNHVYLLLRLSVQYRTWMLCLLVCSSSTLLPWSLPIEEYNYRGYLWLSVVDRVVFTKRSILTLPQVKIGIWFSREKENEILKLHWRNKI